VKSATEENASKVMLTLMNAVGVRRGEYGLDTAKSTDRVTAIEVG
jgi:hypothetical protein